MSEQTTKRLAALRDRMAATGTGLIAIGPGSHMDWVLGFHPHPDERPCLLLIAPEKECFLMPVLNASALVLGVFSAVAVGPGPARPVLAVAAAMVAVVIGISVTRNLPVNRFVSRLNAEDQPANWSEIDPRRRWQFWNTIRSSINAVAFVTNVTALALLWWLEGRAEPDARRRSIDAEVGIRLGRDEQRNTGPGPGGGTIIG